MADVANPWAPENWNLTAQGEYVKKYGVSVAARKARQAGTTLGALQPAPGPGPYMKHLTIINHRTTGGGGGIIGAGSSGDGPPS